MTTKPKELAQKLIEARSRASQGESWIDLVQSNGTIIKLFNEKHTVDLMANEVNFTQAEDDGEFLVQVANHITTVCNRLIELEKLVEKQARQLDKIDKAYSMRASDVYLNHNMSPREYLCKEISEAIYGDKELESVGEG